MFKLPVSFRFFAILILLALGSCTDPAPEGDGQALLIENVRGYTPTAEGDLHFRSLLVKEGKVLALDPDAALLAMHPERKVMDGGGHFLLPGLIDAHGHVESLGHAQSRVDLTGATSLAEARQLVTDFVEQNPELPWILGRGWNQQRWPEARMPEAADLEGIAPDRPIWLNRVDGHAGWANRKTLEIAGIGDDVSDPPGGKILRTADGKVAGTLIDAATELVEKVIPQPGLADRKRALLVAQKLLLAKGLTAVHDAGVSTEGLRAYKQLADGGKLQVRIYAMLGGAETLAEHEGPWSAPRLDVRSVKFYSDGALGSRGAALFEPYLDAPGNRGLLFASTEELADLARQANAKGFQANIHAIGGGAPIGLCWMRLKAPNRVPQALFATVSNMRRLLLLLTSAGLLN